MQLPPSVPVTQLPCPHPTSPTMGAPHWSFSFPWRVIVRAIALPSLFSQRGSRIIFFWGGVLNHHPIFPGDAG